MPIQPSFPRSRRLYYGWKVVAALFIMLGVSSGFGFYNQSVLLAALTGERGFSIATASLATTLFFALGGVAGLGIASLIERFDARLTITLGAVVSAVSLLLVGRVEDPWQALGAFALFGCGFAGISMVTATTLITRWFVRRRSLALAIASTGLSVGGIVLTPLSARSIDGLGLTEATPLLAAGLLVGILPFTWLWIRDRPAELGLQPDGLSAATPKSDADTLTTVDVDIELRDALRSRFFYGLIATFFFGLAAQVGGIAHQFKLVSGHAGPEVAALALSVLAGSSVIGRLVAGWVATRVSLRSLTGSLILAEALALFLLGRAEEATTLLLASSFFGLTVGSFLLMWPLLVAHAFGVRNYARIYSIVGFVVTLGIAAGPSAIGLLHKITGGYPNAFAAAAGVAGLAAFSLWLAGPPRPPLTA